MNWLSDIIRPRVSSFVQQKEVPDNLWQKCPDCDGMLFYRDVAENLNVCYHCGHHMKITVQQRLDLMFDDQDYQEIELPEVPVDPLKFKDKKRYADRLKDSQAKTKRNDAIVAAAGTIGGQKAVVACFDFAFMGGSMGTAVGEGIVRAAEMAVKGNAAFIVVPASGGARMQEGALSLMQMPRTIIAVNMVKEAKLPYLVLLTNPTTGGVSASFAMVGDIHIAEPGTMIGFAGKRVIEETIREKLPEDFQTAEYLLDHGMIDMVVERKDLNSKIGTILSLLMNAGGDAPKGGRAKKSESSVTSIKSVKDVKKASKSAGRVAQKQDAAKKAA